MEILLNLCHFLDRQDIYPGEHHRVREADGGEGEDTGTAKLNWNI
jgi:hypothetical protein